MNQLNKDMGKEHLKLVVSGDLGGSQVKAIAQPYPNGVPQVLAMEPEIADVSKNSIARVSQEGGYTNSIWVGINSEYYALGTLAKTFAGTSALRDLKGYYAVPKLASLLWLACRRFGLKSDTDIFVQVLLPPGEIANGKEIGKKLGQAINRGIITPTTKLKGQIRNFYIAPEGSGIICYRRRALGASYSQKNVGMLMLGYRNANFIFNQKGNSALSETTALGMNWLVQQFVERTAVGLSKEDERIVTAILAAGKGNFDALRPLSRQATLMGVESDLKRFQKTLPDVREDYCRALMRWMRNIAALDEILICGGTADFIREELTEHFQRENVPIVWNGGVEIPKALDTLGLGDRIADVWAAHMTYIKMLDKNLGYERKQELVPDSNSPTPQATSLSQLITYR